MQPKGTYHLEKRKGGSSQDSERSASEGHLHPGEYRKSDMWGLWEKASFQGTHTLESVDEEKVRRAKENKQSKGYALSEECRGWDKLETASKSEWEGALTRLRV
jgi:hypothetical protein